MKIIYLKLLITKINKIVMKIGYIKTKDIVIIKKNIYKLYLFDSKSDYYISYKGKQEGNLIVLFEVLENNRCVIIENIGLMNEENLFITLKYFYNIKRKKIIGTFFNEYENNIQRKIIKDEYIFSIDPFNSKDIDDAISYKNNIVSIYIAQPIYYLNKKNLLKRVNEAFSTIYDYNNNDNLWGDELTYKSSFIQNELRPAFCIKFNIKENIIISFPCYIINNNQTNYNACLNDDKINEFYKMTKEYSKNEKMDTHELISFWMIKVNKYISNNFTNIPYRVIKKKYQDEEIMKVYRNIKNEKIRKIFISKIEDTAFYSMESIDKYTHFTSPIRRIIDTLIHWCITYDIDFKEYSKDLEKINYLSKMTKKYHKDIELLKFINKIEENIYLYGYIFSINENFWTIYFEEFGFYKVKMYSNKFNIIEDFTKYKIGDKLKFEINKINGFLPRQKILIKNIFYETTN